MAKQQEKPKVEEKKIVATNKRARFEYHFVAEFEAGIVLTGTEIKSVRAGKTNLNDAYCIFEKAELFTRNMFIQEYDLGTYSNHNPRRIRKLLLNRSELKKLERRVKEKGFTIVPYQFYINEKGLAKLSIALAQGKKSYDKRESIKEKDNKRDIDRLKKTRI